MKIKEKNKEFRVRGNFLLILALLIAYPVTIHGAIINGYISVALLVFISAFVLLLAKSWIGKMLLGLAGIVIVVFLSSVIGNNVQILLYMMPVMINTTLALFFGQSLLPGKTPIITKYSILFRGKLEPRVAGYTRRVTQMWLFLFILLAAESLVLALFASIETWSLFVNILNYVVIGLFFAGEYYFRIHYLNDLKHPGFMVFLHKLTQVNPGELNK